MLVKYLITITYNSPITNPIKLRPVTINVTGHFLLHRIRQRINNISVLIIPNYIKNSAAIKMEGIYT